MIVKCLIVSIHVAILVVKSIYENIALVTDVYEFIDV